MHNRWIICKLEFLRDAHLNVASVKMFVFPNIHYCIRPYNQGCIRLKKGKGRVKKGRWKKGKGMEGEGRGKGTLYTPEIKLEATLYIPEIKLVTTLYTPAIN